MKLATIAFGTAFALSSAFAFAQGGDSGGSASAGNSTGTSGTTTGANTSGSANQGTGSSAIQSDKMKAGTDGPQPGASGANVSGQDHIDDVNRKTTGNSTTSPADRNAATDDPAGSKMPPDAVSNNPGLAAGKLK